MTRLTEEKKGKSLSSAGKRSNTATFLVKCLKKKRGAVDSTMKGKPVLDPSIAPKAQVGKKGSILSSPRKTAYKNCSAATYSGEGAKRGGKEKERR